MTPLPPSLGNAAVLVWFVVTIAIEVKSQCGQLPAGSLPSQDKDQKLFPPWSVTIHKQNDGVRPEFTIAGVLVTPRIVMSSAFYFVSNDTVMKVPPFRFFQATVGEHQWKLDGNHSRKIGVSHLTLHPKYSMGNYWSNTRNDQMLFHLNVAVNISKEVQPICLPSGNIINQIVQPVGPNPLILTGWDHGVPDEVYLNLDIQTEAMCQKLWKGCWIDDVYENRFCATPSSENNSTASIHRDVAGVREMTNNTFYLAGQMNQLFRKNLGCTSEDLYFFNQYNAYTYSWLKSTERCGPGNFTCGDGKCIPLWKQCNRYKDCKDNEDEVLDFCKYLYKCPEGEFYCGASKDDKCIPDSKVNDGVKDCGNGEDEFETHLSTAQIVVGSVLAVATSTILGLIFLIEYRKFRARRAMTLEADRNRLIEADDMFESESIPNDYSGLMIPSPWKAFRNLICIQKLGKGTFGHVYKAIDLNEVGNCEIAIKCVNISKTLKLQDIQPGTESSSSTVAVSSEERITHALKNVKNEIQVLVDLQSHNINVVGYQGSWAEDDTSRPILDKKKLQKYIEELAELLREKSLSTTKHIQSHIFIKMEYCNFSLGDYLNLKSENSVKQDQDILCIASDIVSGLKYVHTRGYTHRDLKPKNIFCKQGPGNSMNTWKIGDFGLAVRIGSSPETVYQRLAGTITYCSPEMIVGLPYNQTTDLYSLGLVFVELVQQNGTMFNRVSSFERIRKFDDAKKRVQYLSGELAIGRYEDFVHVINQLLNIDPNLRPSAEKVNTWFESRKEIIK